MGYDASMRYDDFCGLLYCGLVLLAAMGYGAGRTRSQNSRLQKSSVAHACAVAHGSAQLDQAQRFMNSPQLNSVASSLRSVQGRRTLATCSLALQGKVLVHRGTTRRPLPCYLLPV